MNNQLQLNQDGTEQVLDAANKVLEAYIACREALKQLKAVAKTNKMKSQCHADIHSLYTKQNLVIYALAGEGVTPVNDKEIMA